jgi:hypothetical protein
MSLTSNDPRRRTSALLTLIVALGVVLWSGCGSDDDNTPPGGGATSTTFKGIFSNGTENGSINATLATTTLAPKPPARQASPLRSILASNPSSKAVVAASGTLRLVGGGTVNLTGSYNDVSDSLNLSGSGYAFGGERDTTGAFNSINGQYTGPNGDGFFGMVTATAAAASTYCGGFASGSSGLTGTWDILIAGAQVGGVGFPTAGTPLAFEGTIQTSGTMRTLTAGTTDAGVFTLTVTGTLNTTNNTISGTWTYDDLTVSNTDDSGSWSGILCP